MSIVLQYAYLYASIDSGKRFIINTVLYICFKCLAGKDFMFFGAV
eukprot:gene11541-4794_t